MAAVSVEWGRKRKIEGGALDRGG
uniref:Uncharacterized protein n=1 Tax=Arundo donax TaxID=35708 RepID=A0A0A9A8J1_ARUDO